MITLKNASTYNLIKELKKRGHLTFVEFANYNLIRCTTKSGFGHNLNDWTISDWMVATLGELGEAANIVKKINRDRDNIPGNKKTKDQLTKMLMDELADTFIYLDLMVQACGFNLEEIAKNKFNSTTLKNNMGNEHIIS